MQIKNIPISQKKIISTYINENDIKKIPILISFTTINHQELNTRPLTLFNIFIEGNVYFKGKNPKHITSY